MNIKGIIAAAAIAIGLATPALAQTWSGPGMGELGRGGPLRSSFDAVDPTTDRMLDFRDINACATNGQILKQNAAGAWACAEDASGTGTGTLSDDTPATVDEGGASAGTDAASSRGDHDHQLGDEAAITLDSVAGIDARIADLSVEVASRTWTTLVNVADGGFVSHAGANNLTTAQAAALTYSVTKTGDAADGARAYVVIRIPDTEDKRDFRIRQSFAGADYYINNWHTIGSTGGFTYAYSRHTLFAGYLIHIQESANVLTTHFRGESDAENVAVDASGFDGSGNLDSTITDAQALADAVDGLAAGGSGTTFSIHALDAETTIAGGDSIPFSDASDSNDDEAHHPPQLRYRPGRHRPQRHVHRPA